MTKPKYSVILPHVSIINGTPNTCIDLCRHLLHKAASMPFEIIDAVDYPDYYTAINESINKTNSDIIITFNDDMFPEPGWDKLLVEHCKPGVAVTTRMIESGRRPVGYPIFNLMRVDYQKTLIIINLLISLMNIRMQIIYPILSLN
jgi:hypothetical protein